MASTYFSYRVIYGDTDESGVVYHANYLRWFEAARCEYLRLRGASYGLMTKRGVYFPVVEAHCRYHRPVRFEDLIVVEVEVLEMGRAALRFGYHLRRDGEDEVLAQGYTLHGCLGDDGRLRRIPEDVRALVLSVPAASQ